MNRPTEPAGEPFFPPRLWVYTNFHCNLACDYCAVASSPKARARSLVLGKFRELVGQAVAEEFTELYLTGGEPLLHPDITAMLTCALQALPTVLLTNAMLLRGARLERLRGLGGHPNLVIHTFLFPWRRRRPSRCSRSAGRHGTSMWCNATARSWMLVPVPIFSVDPITTATLPLRQSRNSAALSAGFG